MLLKLASRARFDRGSHYNVSEIYSKLFLRVKLIIKDGYSCVKILYFPTEQITSLCKQTSDLIQFCCSYIRQTKQWHISKHIKETCI